MNKAITINDLDVEILACLRAEAARRGIGANAVAAEMLKQCFEPAAKRNAMRTLQQLAGTWIQEEADAFLTAIADFGKSSTRA